MPEFPWKLTSRHVFRTLTHRLEIHLKRENSFILNKKQLYGTFGWFLDSPPKTEMNLNQKNNSNYGTDEFLEVTEIFDFSDPSFHIIDSNGDSSDERLWSSWMLTLGRIQIQYKHT